MQYRTNSYAANVFDTFYFEKNLQGDIIAVYNADGDRIGSYIYDAWGNFTVTVESTNTILESKIVRIFNPFRYRGYYYDTETQLYYLQSRYYNPAWGRFLNADGLISTGQGLLNYNMYTYCNNNPVMYVDSAGTFPWKAVGIAVGIIAAIVIIIVVAVNVPTKEEHYNRNANNIEPSEEDLQSIVDGQNKKWEKVDDKFNAYHRFTNGTQGEEAKYNKKYMTLDGKNEVIICYDSEQGIGPYIVYDPNNMGTYNYGPGTGVNHFLKDVLPYWRYGNSPDDTTTVFERMAGN